MSNMYTVYVADDTMIDVIGPEGVVPELDQPGDRVVKTWKSIATIVRVQVVAP